MLVLAIWLTLIGYSVLITGKRNLGISYQPQQDGSIKAVDNQGNPAKTFGVFDVLTCGAASGTTASTPASGTPTQRQAPETPPAIPNLNPIGLPNFRLPALPNLNPDQIPNPIPAIGGGLGIIDAIGRDVYGILSPVVTGIEGELGRLRFPGLLGSRPQL